MPIEFINDGLYHRYFEIIGGKKFLLPSMCPAHASITGSILQAVGNHLIEHKSGYFFANVDVCFDDENIFVPDLCVVLKENEQILAQRDMIHGAPDMVVEVLSRSTQKKIAQLKKTLTRLKACASIGLSTRT